MNEALILEKLETLSAEIQELKEEIRQKPFSQSEPKVSEKPEISILTSELEESLSALRDLNQTLKAGYEFTEEIQPVAKQLLPKAISYLDEIDDQFDIESLKILITKALTSLDAMNEALDMLKSGVELRDDLIPIAKLSYPKVQKFLSSLHEGEFQAEQLGNLLHTILLNIHTFSDLMNMISPMTEFVKEFEVVMKQTDVLASMNKWLDSLQQGNGPVKFLAMTMAAIKKVNLTDEQFDAMCESLSTINLCKVEPVGPVAMIKQMRDPKFQDAMGAIFMIMEAVGGCIHACQASKKKAEDTKG